MCNFWSYWIDNLIKTVAFVTIKVLCLSPVARVWRYQSSRPLKDQKDITHSGRIMNHLAEHHAQAIA